MRDQFAAMSRPNHRRSKAYPSPFARHPVYMYGSLPPGIPDTKTGELADSAILGIREDAASEPAEPHPHAHADLGAQDSHYYMFGVAAEQPSAVSPGEFEFYFLDAGSI